MSPDDRHHPPPRRPNHAPATPGKPHVRVKFVTVIHDGKERTKVTITVTASPGLVADQDTSMFIIPLINGVPPLDANGAPQTQVDAEKGPVTFTVNPGDTYDFAQQDVNIVGPSGISPHVTGTVPPAVPTTIPQTPGAPTVAINP